MKNSLEVYEVVRAEDVTGVSGTGRVAACVVLPSGKAVISWLTDITSVAIYDSMDEAVTIHGHGGNTVFNLLARVYLDD